MNTRRGTIKFRLRVKETYGAKGEGSGGERKRWSGEEAEAKEKERAKISKAPEMGA